MERYGPPMPEILEIEYYRQLAEGALDRSIKSVAIDRYAGRSIAPGMNPKDVLPGLSFTAARRRGKLLLLDTEGPVFGMRFGMTGGLVLDGVAGIDKLEYGPGTYEDKWIRAGVYFEDGGALLFHDPRRFGRVSLNPDEEALGPDAFSITLKEFRAALGARGEGPALKARLLDQTKIAGIGNLLADEILWRARLSPLRGSASLTESEIKRLHRVQHAVLIQLFERGGSHTGDHMDERHPGGRCSKDGHALHRATVGGRTTWWCPKHQV
jgi:formamidopyrimidine-DNA glycosylase